MNDYFTPEQERAAKADLLLSYEEGKQRYALLKHKAVEEMDKYMALSSKILGDTLPFSIEPALLRDISNEIIFLAESLERGRSEVTRLRKVLEGIGLNPRD